MKSKNIAIFGSYSGYNKGDLAILISIIKNIDKLNSRVNFFVSSKNPKNVLKYIENKNVEVYKTSTPHLGYKTLKYLKKTDILIYGGGGLFFDRKLYNPFYNHIINLFILSIINKLFFKKPIYIFCIGCSHLKSNISIFLTKFILNSASFISVRDSYTFSKFSQLTNTKIYESYDPGFLLTGKANELTDSFLNTLPLSKKKIVISINNSTFLIKDQNLEGLLQGIKALLEEYVVVLCSNDSTTTLVETIFLHFKNKNLLIFDLASFSPEEIIYFFSKFDYLIASPMHSAIFGYVAGVKLITVIYDDKVSEFNKIIGNINTVSISNLDKLQCTINNYKTIPSDKRKNVVEGAKTGFRQLLSYI